jgi:multidrug efflux pump subunit AcrB
VGGAARRVEQAMRRLELPRGATFALSGKVEETREAQRRLAIARSGRVLEFVTHV